jgi:hypothetical protein
MGRKQKYAPNRPPGKGPNGQGQKGGGQNGRAQNPNAQNNNADRPPNRFEKAKLRHEEAQREAAEIADAEAKELEAIRVAEGKNRKAKEALGDWVELTILEIQGLQEAYGLLGSDYSSLEETIETFRTEKAKRIKRSGRVRNSRIRTLCETKIRSIECLDCAKC